MNPGDLFRVRSDAESLEQDWIVHRDPKNYFKMKSDYYHVTAGDLFRLHENGDIEHAIHGFTISDLGIEEGDADLEPVIGDW